MTRTRSSAPWPLIEGVVLCLLGLGALVMPLAAGVAATVVFAWILTLTGMIGLISALAGRGLTHLGWSLTSAALALIIGALMIFDPLGGAVSLTVLIGVWLLLDAFAQLGLALAHRRQGDAGWSWLLVSGVIDLALAVMIAMMSVIGSAVMLGVVVGLSLIIAGLTLAAAHRRLSRT